MAGRTAQEKKKKKGKKSEYPRFKEASTIGRRGWLTTLFHPNVHQYIYYPTFENISLALCQYILIIRVLVSSFSCRERTLDEVVHRERMYSEAMMMPSFVLSYKIVSLPSSNAIDLLQLHSHRRRYFPFRVTVRVSLILHKELFRSSTKSDRSCLSTKASLHTS